MRKVSKELGGQVPCEPCKDANDRQGKILSRNVSFYYLLTSIRLLP